MKTLNDMKARYLLAPLAALCALAGLGGCASADRHVSRAAFDKADLNRDEKPFSTERSQQVNLNQRAFQKLDLDTNRAVTLDEWQHFDASAGAKENFSALDENLDGRINATEFLRQPPKYSKPYRFFGGTNPSDESYSLSDSEVFQQQGWQLFSFHF